MYRNFENLLNRFNTLNRFYIVDTRNTNISNDIIEDTSYNYNYSLFNVNENTSNIGFYNILNNINNDQSINILSMHDLSLNDYINDICTNIINTIINTAVTDITNDIIQKKVISDEDYNNLVTVKYSTIKNETSIIECPISFTAFENDTLVTKLPCKHIFIPNSINRWLKTHSNTCPVCRYEFNFLI